jgi:tRNA-2-methylthio-N6-dimethylallyladenosine synthase
MRYHIWTEGCQMNEADSEKLAAGLARLGWEEASAPDDADLAVVNTCVVRQKAEDRAVGYMSKLKKLKAGRDGMQIAVMGCMVGPRSDDLRARFPFVDVWARPQNFDVIIRQLMPEDDLGGEFWPETFPEPKGPTAFVPIIHGCNKFCTYCIVPFRRGREKSRTIGDITSEVASLARKGVREVTLLGQTVEAYGKDLPEIDGAARKPDLADLFESISAIDDIVRIRFLTSYPRDMTDRIIQSVGDQPKVCEHFNIPVQAGDNETLARMRRGYTIEEYLECVAKIREHVPHAALSTDVIVGFCGETEAQFQHTLDVLEQVRFDKVHVAAYSPRPGTFAWRQIEDDVPQEEKSHRLHAVEALQERVSTEKNSVFLHATQEVLVEGESEGPEGQAVFTGRNRANKLVHFSARPAPSFGDLVSVRVTKTTPWSLQGEMVPAGAAAAA